MAIGGEQNMGGLLGGDFNDPMTQGILGLSAGLLAGGAPSVGKPVSLGGALGQGLMMGQNAFLSSNIVITPNGNPLLILTGCSVFANLSYISLLWFSLYVFYQCPIRRLSWVILGVATGFTLASNAIRLALMTRSTQDYIFYHDGAGAQVFEWGLMALVLVLVIGGCRYERTV